MKRLIPVAMIVVFAACGSASVETDGKGTGQSELKGGCKWVCPKCKPNDLVCSKAPCTQECSGQGGTEVKDPAVCGSTLCKVGEVCCNSSCGICTKPGGACIELFCGCASDADCRLFSDYCTGCDCRALRTVEVDPVCEGPGVRCFADPCGGKTAVCEQGACVVR